MSEQEQAQAAPEADEGKGQEPTGNVAKSQEPPATGESGNAPAEEGGDELENLSKAELIKRLGDLEKHKKNLNKEAEGYRKKARQYESQEEARRKEQLSQTEALQEENTDLKGQNETLLKQVKRWQFERALNLPDADLAWGMLDDLGLEVQWGDNNVPQNIDEIRKTLKREKPRVWGNGSANGGERSEPPEATGGDFVNQLFHSRGGNRQRARR